MGAAAALVLAAPAGLTRCGSGGSGPAPAPEAPATGASPYGPLEPDPGGILDLPRGFQYRVVSPVGDRLSDGAPVPGQHDGMAAFPARGGGVLLVRNHEVGEGEGPPVEGRAPYDREAPGGTTGVLVDPDRRQARAFVLSSGTLNNCAGGVTPWGTWLTCEEDLADGHGYVFEVDPRAPEGRLSRTPIRDMGVFSHEAAAVDPRTGIVYLTEDDSRNVPEPDGPQVSFLYRYLPDDRRPQPGALKRGGRLEVLSAGARWVGDAAAEVGQGVGVKWVPIRAERAREDAFARGGTRFTRIEGALFSDGVVWLNDTAGGPRGLGRIFRLLPGAEGGDRLELVVASTGRDHLTAPDTLTRGPETAVTLAEDLGRGARVSVLTPAGEVVPLARTSIPGAELTGPCYSPDGGTLFLNIQEPGMTLAVWGPFGAGTTRA